MPAQDSPAVYRQSLVCGEHQIICVINSRTDRDGRTSRPLGWSSADVRVRSHPHNPSNNVKYCVTRNPATHPTLAPIGLVAVRNQSTRVLDRRTYQPRANLTVVLFGQTRRAVLGYLYRQPDKSFYLGELARHAGTGLGAVPQEVVQLAQAGILRRSVRGNREFYQANPDNPIVQELKSIIAKTAGTHDILRGALFPLRERIPVAFVYGSVARQEERADRDVD